MSTQPIPRWYRTGSIVQISDELIANGWTGPGKKGECFRLTVYPDGKGSIRMKRGGRGILFNNHVGLKLAPAGSKQDDFYDTIK